MIEDPWTYVFAWVSTIGSAATAAALFFLWNQSRQTKKQIQLTEEEIKSKLRPWLDISDISRNEKGGYVQVVVTNTGNIAAKLVRTQQSLSSSPITEDQLRSGKDITNRVVILPDGKKDIALAQSLSYQYLGVLVQYEYAKNKHGESGLMVKYNDLVKRFEVLEEFAA